eukprot:TRINITY_DN5831_c0_g1_i2.p1 TRINITY_DN5831_c0_g1~~TRINITY_DN5831_c0_g1_i2.p1  ORF type:complete len:219 (-),score=31.21 TRINITY_DN5831_c0_g1_i2:213-869(-)
MEYHFCAIWYCVNGSWRVAAGESDQIEENIPVFRAFGLRDLSIGVAVIGACLVVVALIGFIAALKRIKLMLSVYAVFMFLVIFGQIAVAIVFATTVKDKVGTVLEEDMEDVFVEWAQSEDEEDLDRIEKYQTRLECCGWDFPEDLNGVGDDCMGRAKKYTIGCKEATDIYIDQLFSTIVLVCAILGSVEFVCLVSTCVMMCKSSDYGEEDPFKHPMHY